MKSTRCPYCGEQALRPSPYFQKFSELFQDYEDIILKDEEIFDPSAVMQ